MKDYTALISPDSEQKGRHSSYGIWKQKNELDHVQKPSTSLGIRSTHWKWEKLGLATDILDDPLKKPKCKTGLTSYTQEQNEEV